MGLFEGFECLSMLVRTVVPSGLDVFQIPTVQGLGHVAEGLDEVAVYVASPEETAEPRKVFGELGVGDGR